jgi:glycogen synthase
MRIALASREYPPESAKGGLGTQTYAKAHGLVESGHDVIVISQARGRLRQEKAEGRLRIVRIPGFEHRLPLHTEAADWLTYSAEVAAALNSIHESTPLDLVDFPEWGGEGYIYLLNRTGWDPKPATVIHVHGPMAMFAHVMGWPDIASDFYRVGTEMEGASLRLADAVFASSSYSAEWCAKSYGLERERIPTIHTGIDVIHFSPRPKERDARPTILFAGRITYSKGVLELMEAACRLVDEFPQLRLRMLGHGDPPVVRELRSMAARYGAPDLLDLPGFVSREDLPNQLNRANIFAAPSKCEGGPGFVYLEAMACGLPVIACEDTGAMEVVSPGENGMLVPPGDADALEHALRRLLSDSDLRDHLAKGARAFVEREADNSMCLRRIEEFYVEVVTRSGELERVCSE